VKPAPFQYERPRTLDDALRLLAERGDDAVPLAGGQSLVPMMNLRLARPGTVVDLNDLPGLDGIEEQDGMLVIGAMARQRDVERSPLCARQCPLLVSALRHVGNPQTRNRGTIGGNLAQADPASELPTVVAACGGVIVLASVDGTRELDADAFFVRPFTNARAAGELLVEVRIPALRDDQGWAFDELAPSYTAHAILAVSAVADAGGVRAAVAGVPGSPRLVSHPDDLANVADPYHRAAAGDLVRRVSAQALERMTAA
jgi:aerobic carbon-monoxide dehydrogenase medium subunit